MSGRGSGAGATGASDVPGPLVDTAWLRAHLRHPDVRVVHVSPDRAVYEQRHIPGAVFADLHAELAKRGRVPETGDVEREWLVPGRQDVERAIQRWGVAAGDRVVFYDDVGKNRHAIRGHWLLR